MSLSLSTIELVLDTLVIQALVLAVLFFARRSSAATQHLFLSVAVLMVLAVTVISPVVPDWKLGLIPVEEVAVDRAAPSATIDLPEAAPEGAIDRPRETASPENRVQRTLAGVWVLGSALLLLWMVLGVMYSWWLNRQARPTESSQLRDRFHWALEQVGLRPGAALVESEVVKIPVVFGFIRPTVILPTHATRWSEDRLRAVLLHESAHIRRKDLVFQFLAKLTCAIYWFNPLAWLIERKLFLAGERAADDQVIRQEVPPADYAEHLMETSVELGTERNPIWATAAMAEGTAFKDRILSILDPNIRRGEPNMSNQAAVTLAATAMVFSLLAFSPWRGASSPSAPEVSSATQRPVVLQQGNQGDFETLVQMLQLQDPDMREHAASVLGELGDERAVLPLIQVILNDGNASVREHACEALGALGDVRALDPLITVMRTDGSARVREHCAGAVGELQDPRSYETLLEVMYGGDTEQVRAHAAEALGSSGDPRALGPLLNVLQDGSAVMRMHAAMGLGELGDERAAGALRQAEDDPDRQVRQAAREALRKIRER
jgi:beta-lactamase regulating signal transducer with metallopeptidase domain